MPPAGNQVAFPEDKKLFELAFEPGVGLQGFADNPAGHDPPARLPPAGAEVIHLRICADVDLMPDYGTCSRIEMCRRCCRRLGRESARAWAIGVRTQPRAILSTPKTGPRRFPGHKNCRK